MSVYYFSLRSTCFVHLIIVFIILIVTLATSVNEVYSCNPHTRKRNYVIIRVMRHISLALCCLYGPVAFQLSVAFVRKRM